VPFLLLEENIWRSKTVISGEKTRNFKVANKVLKMRKQKGKTSHLQQEKKPDLIK